MASAPVAQVDAGETAYWWTHTTLGEEAAPPDTTAAEGTAAALAAVAAAVQTSLSTVIASVASATTTSAIPLSTGEVCALYTRLGLRQQLPPLLGQVRRTMERAWWERHSDDETSNRHTNGAGGSEGLAKATTTGVATAAGSALGEKTRSQLAEVQRQVYGSFWRAVLRGASAAVSEVSACSPFIQRSQQQQQPLLSSAHALLPACVDALLTDMCFGVPAAGAHSVSGEKEEDDGGNVEVALNACSQSRRVWLSGFLHSLRANPSVTAGSGTSANCDEKASAQEADLSILLGYAADFIHGELGLTGLDRAHNFPLLCEEAAQQVRAAFKRCTSSGGIYITDSVADMRSLTIFFQSNAAVVLRSAGDGLLLRTADAHAMGCAPLLAATAGTTLATTSAETATSAALVFRAASLASVAASPSGGAWFLEATTHLLDACHAAFQRVTSTAHAASHAQQAEETDGNEGEGSGNAAVREGEKLAAALKALKAAYYDRLGRQSLYLVAVLGQYASTRAHVLSVLHVITERFYHRGAWVGIRALMVDLTAFREQHEAGGDSRQGDAAAAAITASTKVATGAPVVPMPWRSFADVCLARVAAVLPAIMESPPPALLVARSSPDKERYHAGVDAQEVALPLGISLLYSPITVWLRMLWVAVNPPLLSRTCVADAAVSESGGGSARRGNAFEETEAVAMATRGASEGIASTHRAALSLFPKLHALFCAVEAAMQGMLDGSNRAIDSSSDTMNADSHASAHPTASEPLTRAAVLVSYVGNAIAEAVLSMMRDGAGEVAAGQVLMYMAFALSPTPAFPTTCLAFVRAALRLALARLSVAGASGVSHASAVRDTMVNAITKRAAGAADATAAKVTTGTEATSAEGDGAPTDEDARVLVLQALRHLLVDRRHYGLAVFFLPLLRALGLDHGAAAEDTRTSMAIAVRYPASCHVAFLSELPHSYFTQSDRCIAVSQAADALAYLDVIALTKLSSKDGKSNNDSDNSNSSESLTAFVEMMSESGSVVLARLRELAHARPTDGIVSGNPTNTNDKVTSRGPPLHPVVIDVLTNVFFGTLRLCADVTHWPRSVRADLQRRIVERTLQKLQVNVKEKDSEEGAQLAVVPAAYLLRDGTGAEDHGGDTTPDSHNRNSSGVAFSLTHMERWLWSAELEALDDAPFTAFRTLVRECNVSYMRHVSTRTLLRCRTAVDAQGDTLREARAKALENVDKAVIADVDALWESMADKVRETAEAAGRTRRQEEEYARRAAEKAARKSVNVKKAAVGAGAEAQPTEEEGGRETNEEDMKTEGGAATTPAAPVAAALRPPAAPPLPRVVGQPDLKAYTDKVFDALLLRARLSPVDGAVCGIAAERFFLTLATHPKLEPRTATALLRQFMERLRSQMAHIRPAVCTRQEAASLALVMHHTAEHLALPYKMSFHPPSGLPQAMRNHVASVERAFTSKDEADAVMTLTAALDALSNLVKLFLARLTLVGDWSAWALVYHCSRLFRLITRQEEAFAKAVATRREAIGRSGIASPGFQALVAVERPLGEGMTAPAVSVSRLYTRARFTEQSSASASGSVRAKPKAISNAGGGVGGGRRGDGRENERERDRDRSRDRDRDKDQERERERGRDRDRGGRTRRPDDRKVDNDASSGSQRASGAKRTRSNDDDRRDRERVEWRERREPPAAGHGKGSSDNNKSSSRSGNGDGSGRHRGGRRRLV